MSNKDWVYSPQAELKPEIVELVGNKQIAQLIVNRGIDTLSKLKNFLNPEKVDLTSPFVFCDMQKAVERVEKAVIDGQNVLVYGDFDADGVTSTSLLYKTLKHIGANVTYYMPNRMDESHGLNSAAVCTQISKNKIKLIITVDCGISNIKEVKLANGLGADVILTDHHEPPEILPEAYAVINPKVENALKDDLSIETIEDMNHLAGVGVAYKLSMALLEHYNKLEFEKEIIHLVAIGTIADVVPVIGENRALITKGIAAIQSNRPKGVVKVLEKAGVNLETGINSDTIAFMLAPRINATGRLDSAEIAVNLLISDDDLLVDVNAEKLNNYNKVRQDMCAQTFDEALSKIDKDPAFKKNKAIVLVDKDWHPGIIGIVASKLVEKFYKPAFMIVVDTEKQEARCSARSTDDLHLYNFLCQNSNLLNHFGGHALAAGFSVDLTQIKIEDFVAALNNAVNESLNGVKSVPKQNIDMALDSDDLTFDFVQNLSILEPFGECNPAPVFSLKGLNLKQFRTIGQNKNHLKLTFEAENRQHFEGVWWSKSDLEIPFETTVDFAFSPKINKFNDKISLQLEARDILWENEIKKKDLVKWLDHRKKSNIEADVNDYVSKTADTVAVFAEHNEVIKRLSSYKSLSERIISRLNIQNVDQIMFFDYPSDETVFQNLLEIAQPRIVHLMGYKSFSDNPSELLRTITGMLKYVYSNKNGKVDVGQISSKLALSDDAVVACFELLQKAGVIDILDNNTEFAFEFLKSASFKDMANLPEYKAFIDEINFCEQFKKELLEKDIEELQLEYEFEPLELVKN